ncbi:MAG: hypothetical protein JJ953_15045 [Gracilimonas sp.]|uniref:hypothetical protein n=1 Tax=Gracilimonas sp. TaxID=1974203 RepID=UPI001B27851C|nr:hypothetical protein [Gracilimonas sp.]MBO6587423.1 hypothetical protein [Gracilimonas sp.]MBO6617050.1 hypothetical protein [Gracilimonas sp.]
MVQINTYPVKKITLFVLTVFTVANFSACNTGVSSNEQVINVQEVRADLSNRFDNLEEALKNSEANIIDAKIFKEEALKYLLNIDKSSENYVVASKNYDIAYSDIINKNSLKSRDNEPLITQEINALSSQVVNASDYESIKVLFDNFYERVLSSDKFTLTEQNQLLNAAAWYEASLSFYKDNYQMFVGGSSFKTITSMKLIGCGWWKRWGKCVAGTLGGYYGGALAGCGIGGGVGAAAGGVGAIPGCGIGATIGAVGGALTGAAASCDGCSQ